MITKRLLIAQAALLLGLGSVFILPNTNRPQPAGVVLELPGFVSPDWVGTEVPITERERQILAADTGFARKRYVNRRGDSISLGIVLSGEDLANSIHRPERCLPAQGAVIQSTDRRSVALSDSSPLELTRLHNQRGVQTRDGKPLSVQALTYYWFIGSHDRTPSHLTRTFIDIKDRLLRGENQRWAYVTAEAIVTDGIPGVVGGKDEQETAAMIEDFLPRVVPSFQRQEKTPAVASAASALPPAALVAAPLPGAGS